MNRIREIIYEVEIDDSGKTGKSIVHLLKDLSKSIKGIHLIKTVEDDEFLQAMKVSVKTGKVSKSEINKTLKILEKWGFQVKRYLERANLCNLQIINVTPMPNLTNAHNPNCIIN